MGRVTPELGSWPSSGTGRLYRQVGMAKETIDVSLAASINDGSLTYIFDRVLMALKGMMAG
jgi:hypothetical protein